MFAALAPMLGSMATDLLSKNNDQSGVSITGTGGEGGPQQTPYDIAKPLLSKIGGMGKDAASNIGGSMLGGISTGLTNEVTDKLFGSSADKDKEALDKLYPGTSSWDRLQGGGGGVTTPAGGSAVQKQQMSIPEKVAEINRKASERSAKATEKAATLNSEASKYSADKNFDAQTGRVGILGTGFHTRLLRQIGEGLGLIPSGVTGANKDPRGDKEMIENQREAGRYHAYFENI